MSFAPTLLVTKIIVVAVSGAIGMGRMGHTAPRTADPCSLKNNHTALPRPNAVVTTVMGTKAGPWLTGSVCGLLTLLGRMSMTDIIGQELVETWLPTRPSKLLCDRDFFARNTVAALLVACVSRRPQRWKNNDSVPFLSLRPTIGLKISISESGYHSMPSAQTRNYIGSHPTDAG